MSDQKEYSEDYYYDKYSKLYRERELNIYEERNRLERLIELDKGIIKDSINDLKVWLEDDSKLPNKQSNVLLEAITKHKENRLHIINPVQFTINLTDMVKNVVSDSSEDIVRSQDFFSEPFRLIVLVAHKGKSICRMQKQERALNKIDYDIQNNQLNKISDIELLLVKFAEDFAKNPNFKRSKEELIAYLKSWVNTTGYAKRVNAKRKAVRVCPSLESAADGTLSNWEENWKKFLNSRTEK